MFAEHLHKELKRNIDRKYKASEANILLNVYKTAKALLEDQDDLVQKGYGWMLKEASNRYPQEIFDFVMRHKTKMPRTALRYAIEKLPVHMRKKALV